MKIRTRIKHAWLALKGEEIFGRMKTQFEKLDRRLMDYSRRPELLQAWEKIEKLEADCKQYKTDLANATSRVNKLKKQLQEKE